LQELIVARKAVREKGEEITSLKAQQFTHISTMEREYQETRYCVYWFEVYGLGLGFRLLGSGCWIWTAQHFTQITTMERDY